MGPLYISGAGITNDSGLTQNFVNDVSSSDQTPSVHGEIVFKNGATAGNATVFTNRGIISFLDNATAANGTFTNDGATAPAASGGATIFYGNSSAAKGTFTNQGGSAPTGGGGVMLFASNSSAASATLVADAGTNGGTGGMIQFMGSLPVAHRASCSMALWISALIISPAYRWDQSKETALFPSD